MQILNQKRIKLLFLPIILAGLFFAQGALAQQLPDRSEDCNNLYKWFTIQFDNGSTTNAIEGLPTICTAQSGISWFIQMLLLFAGSVAVIFIIIGGFRYLTSAGNEEAAESGKKTLITSVVGLVIIVLAATIVRIVATNLGTRSASKPPASTQQTNP